MSLLLSVLCSFRLPDAVAMLHPKAAKSRPWEQSRSQTEPSLRRRPSAPSTRTDSPVPLYSQRALPGGEEVGACHDIGVGSEKLVPCRRPYRAGRDALLLQGLGDRGSGDAVSDLLQLALDAAVAPARVLRRHAHDELPDLLHARGRARSVAACAPPSPCGSSRLRERVAPGRSRRSCPGPERGRRRPGAWSDVSSRRVRSQGSPKGVEPIPRAQVCTMAEP